MNQAEITPMHGPFVIVCRGHSGGRVASEAFVRNGIDMGKRSRKTKDTSFFAPVQPSLVRELTLLAPKYSGLEDAHKEQLQSDIRQLVESYTAKQITDRQRPFGWKLGASLYLAPLLLDAIPSAKIIHLIRDGRDVMLSRMGPARFENLGENSLRKLLVFGDSEIKSFNGIPLNRLDVESVRNELEMSHWVASVQFGLGLRSHAHVSRCLEVRYEDICRNPVLNFEKIFAFLNVPFKNEAKEWLNNTVHTNRIGKWKKYPEEQLIEPIRIGTPLLRELGYVE